MKQESFVFTSKGKLLLLYLYCFFVYSLLFKLITRKKKTNRKIILVGAYIVNEIQKTHKKCYNEKVKKYDKNILQVVLDL